MSLWLTTSAANLNGGGGGGEGCDAGDDELTSSPPPGFELPYLYLDFDPAEEWLVEPADQMEGVQDEGVGIDREAVAPGGGDLRLAAGEVKKQVPGRDESGSCPVAGVEEQGMGIEQQEVMTLHHDGDRELKLEGTVEEKQQLGRDEAVCSSIEGKMEKVRLMESNESDGDGDESSSTESESESESSSEDDESKSESSSEDDESKSETSSEDDDDEDVNEEANKGRKVVKLAELEEGEFREEEPNRSEDEEEGEIVEGPIRSKHEIELPPVPQIEASLEAYHKTMPVGVVMFILDDKVIVEGEANHNPLGERSILWITETRSPLGVVDEIFGPVKNPYYVVRYNSYKDVPSGISVGTEVSFVMEFACHVLNEKQLYKKGYDASGENDEEVEEEVEFSDDEKEAEYKRFLRREKRGPDHRKQNGQETLNERRHNLKSDRAMKKSLPSAPATSVSVDLPKPGVFNCSRLGSSIDNSVHKSGGFLGPTFTYCVTPTVPEISQAMQPTSGLAGPPQMSQHPNSSLLQEQPQQLPNPFPKGNNLTSGFAGPEISQAMRLTSGLADPPQMLRHPSPALLQGGQPQQNSNPFQKGKDLTSCFDGPEISQAMQQTSGLAGPPQIFQHSSPALIQGQPHQHSNPFWKGKDLTSGFAGPEISQAMQLTYGLAGPPQMLQHSTSALLQGQAQQHSNPFSPCGLPPQAGLPQMLQHPSPALVQGQPQQHSNPFLPGALPPQLTQNSIFTQGLFPHMQPNVLLQNLLLQLQQAATMFSPGLLPQHQQQQQQQQANPIYSFGFPPQLQQGAVWAHAPPLQQQQQQQPNPVMHGVALPHPGTSQGSAPNGFQNNVVRPAIDHANQIPRDCSNQNNIVRPAIGHANHLQQASVWTHGLPLQQQQQQPSPIMQGVTLPHPGISQESVPSGFQNNIVRPAIDQRAAVWTHGPPLQQLQQQSQVMQGVTLSHPGTSQGSFPNGFQHNIVRPVIDHANQLPGDCPNQMLGLQQSVPNVCTSNVQFSGYPCSINSGIKNQRPSGQTYVEQAQLQHDSVWKCEPLLQQQQQQQQQSPVMPGLVLPHPNTSQGSIPGSSQGHVPNSFQNNIIHPDIGHASQLPRDCSNQMVNMQQFTSNDGTPNAQFSGYPSNPNPGFMNHGSSGNISVEQAQGLGSISIQESSMSDNMQSCRRRPRLQQSAVNTPQFNMGRSSGRGRRPYGRGRRPTFGRSDQSRPGYR